MSMLAAAKPDRFLIEHIDCVLASGNCQVAIRIDPMDDRVTESLWQPSVLPIDQYDAVNVGWLKIFTSVPVEPEAIYTHERVNTDMTRFQQLHGVQCLDHSIAPANQYDFLSLSFFVFNPRSQNFGIAMNYRIKKAGANAATVKATGKFSQMPPVANVRCGFDEDYADISALFRVIDNVFRPGRLMQCRAAAGREHCQK